MNNYVTGSIIKKLREEKGITQNTLADLLGVTDKAVSKWETSKGLPDITLIEPLASALGVSITELLNGEQIINSNKSANILKSKFYVCPLCGNVICSMGETVISCCGIQLPALEATNIDIQHKLKIEKMEDEYFVAVNHDMSKKHYISFMALVSSDRCQFVKLYPESNAETRFQIKDSGYLYVYCNKHGLMKQKI